MPLSNLSPVNFASKVSFCGNSNNVNVNYNDDEIGLLPCVDYDCASRDRAFTGKNKSRKSKRAKGGKRLINASNTPKPKQNTPKKNNIHYLDINGNDVKPSYQKNPRKDHSKDGVLQKVFAVVGACLFGGTAATGLVITANDSAKNAVQNNHGDSFSYNANLQNTGYTNASLLSLQTNSSDSPEAYPYLDFADGYNNYFSDEVIIREDWIVDPKEAFQAEETIEDEDIEDNSQAQFVRDILENGLENRELFRGETSSETPEVEGEENLEDMETTEKIAVNDRYSDFWGIGLLEDIVPNEEVENIEEVEEEPEVIANTAFIDAFNNCSNFNGGVLMGRGEMIDEICREFDDIYNENMPYLVAAIMANESGWGKSPAIKNHNNPAGVMIGKKVKHFSTLEDGVRYSIKNIANNYIRKGIVTVKDMGDIYAPVGASNDPKNLNKNWIPGVVSVFSELKGEKISKNTILFDV